MGIETRCLAIDLLVPLDFVSALAVEPRSFE